MTPQIVYATDRDKQKFVEVHLRSAAQIAELFCVRHGTVVEWAERGAPIIRVGKRLQANYRELWRWLKENENALN